MSKAFVCPCGKSVVVGGSNGVGLAVALTLSETEQVVIVDKVEPDAQLPENVEFVRFNLLSEDYSLFDRLQDVDKLVITAGFGRLSLFENVSEEELVRMMQVNAVGVMRIIHHYYNKLHSKEDFFCAVMVSISGFMSSPFFAVYGASKAALKIFIESLNVELLKSGTTNQILNVSPGSLGGTRFEGAKNDLSLTLPFAKELIDRMMNKEDLFIPHYEETFKEVLARYAADFRKEGAHSYDYKLNSGRLK
ncbi:SDR family oxidoreductase [Phocaeicola sp.]|uniref:SDR family NAD(P)-dependent oxidoreductase n=1 Tax=Phocaeicola sp. TaxID=2773926 RepID=UPI0023BB9E8D|nr:SDR family oxidoreductase [Phocaeicola sp.]MDE5678606.1 SDR family oxidoreductase [Phocaeicola sp.]